ncbi:class I SAM-dependent DNA methyltransferase [Propionibacteriaceae bacterium Y1700]|uniref:class I SAM-dependent DNA methyltransferase n=1 Tax=Microlunatus sp. Y1700 TaxID=3418487 RepID=UPI003DA6EB59
MAYGPEFAQFYDRHWRAFGETVAPKILAHVEPLVGGRRVLDLCCGTGASSQVFAEDGWTVTGVDASAAMINIARRRADAADWGSRTSYVVQDVTRLDLAGQEPYDVVLCLYDSINHLPGSAAVAAMVESAAELADAGAHFVLDLNTPQALAGWGDTDEVIVDEAGRLTLSAAQDAERGTTTLHVQGQLGAGTGNHDTFSEEHVEHLVDLASLSASLTAAGWHRQRFTTYANLSVDIADPASVRRLVVMAVRT